MKKIEIKCKLTHKRGKPAKSHLIPRALTNLHKSQASRLQVSYDGKKDPRHDSWYDTDLCTEEGELILSKLDEYGIEELREQNLIWDSWGFCNKLRDVTGKNLSLSEEEEGIRIVNFSDLNRIKVFLLSILWRVAASKRIEMQDVSLTEEEIEKLRLIINNNRFDLVKYFPITLIQLSTKGPIHNRTPYTEMVSFEGREVKQARIYFDGLIARVSVDINDGKFSFLDGAEGQSCIICKSYEKSLQKDQMSELVQAHADPSFLHQKKELSSSIELIYRR